MNIKYTTDGLDFHFVIFSSRKRKMTEIFYATTKTKVVEKLIDWLKKNLSDVPLNRFKFTEHQININS
jgi:hypothetical protein